MKRRIGSRSTHLIKNGDSSPVGVMDAYNTSTWEVEVGGLKVQGQSRLHSGDLSQKRAPEK
jgi:hypothetical protein